MIIEEGENGIFGLALQRTPVFRATGHIDRSFPWQSDRTVEG
jgi:hypothetical protein